MIPKVGHASAVASPQAKAIPLRRQCQRVVKGRETISANESGGICCYVSKGIKGLWIMANLLPPLWLINLIDPCRAILSKFSFSEFF
jgi:hypothetical protein